MRMAVERLLAGTGRVEGAVVRIKMSRVRFGRWIFDASEVDESRVV